MPSSTPPITTASEPPARVLEIPVLVWVRLIRQLYQRGGQQRESGAFLLGNRGDGRDRVKAYACYDDLDPNALDTGVVMFDPSGFAALWKVCRRLECEVLADVHTHPDAHPRQSEVDRTNPMMPEVGHVALILPSFAGTWGWKFRNVAIYEYAGDYRWHDWAGPRRRERVRFCWW